MRCASCQYALWNLTSPACPECGLPFDVAAYSFEPQSVAFVCPQCQQQHYGVTEDGLPTAGDTFQCANCSALVDVHSVPVVPLVANPDAAMRGVVPWEQTERPMLERFWETVKLGAMEPTKLGRGITQGGNWTDAFWFLVLMTAITNAVGFVIQVVVQVGIYFAFSGGGGGGFGPGAGGLGPGGGGAIAAQLGVAAVMSVIFVFLGPLMSIGIWCGLAHLVVRGAETPTGPFTQTIRSMAYANGPMLATIVGNIPLCGGLISLGALVWMVVTSILSLSASQRISGGRATGAVLLAPILSVVVSCGIVGLVAGLIAAFA